MHSEHLEGKKSANYAFNTAYLEPGILSFSTEACPITFKARHKANLLLNCGMWAKSILSDFQIIKQMQLTLALMGTRSS